MVEHRVQAADAIRLVQAQLERERRRYAVVYGHCDADLQITSVDEYEMGWLVFYQAAEAVRDVAGCGVLVGHSPYLVGGDDAGLCGTWFWHSDLGYYVEHYRLELDPRFTAHALSHRHVGR